MGDLVVRLRATDDTGPAVMSTIRGMTQIGDQSETIATKVQRSWSQAGGMMGGLQGAVQSNARRLVAEAQRAGPSADLDDPEGLRGLDGNIRRMQVLDQREAHYLRAHANMSLAVSRLAQDEIVAGEVSERVMHRTLSQEDRLFLKKKETAEKVKGVSRQAQGAIQSGMYAIDDAIAGGMNGGMRGAMMGASNNITMMAMQLGGMKAQFIAIGAVAAVQVGIRVYDALNNTAGKAKELADNLAAAREQNSKLLSEMQKRALRPTDVAGQDTNSLAKTRDDSQRRIKEDEQELKQLTENYNQMRAQRAKMKSDKDFVDGRSTAQWAVDLLPDSFNDRAFSDTHLRFSTDLDQQSRQLFIEQQRAHRKRLNSISPQNDEYFADIEKNITKLREREKELLERIQVQRQTLGLIAEEKVTAEAREASERQKEAQEQMEKEEKLAARKSKLLERQQRELQQLQGKQSAFGLKLFGQEGQQENVLAEMHARITEARELFAGKPVSQQQAESQIRSIAEEKLAKLAFADREKQQSTKSPSLALAGSQRAREISLGAGNQLLDAQRKEDKHRSKMEQLTQEVRDGIKEMVANSKEDEEVEITMK